MAESGGELLGFGKASPLDPPDDAPPNAIPPGWHLSGLGVAPGPGGAASAAP